MDLLELLKAALESKTGAAGAVALLTVLMYVLQKVPVVGEWIAKSAVSKKVATVALAVVPAVILSITTKVSAVEAVLTAVLTGLAALGVQGLLPSKSA